MEKPTKIILIAIIISIFSIIPLAPILTAAKQTQAPPKLIILIAGYGWYWSIPPGQINNAELVARALNGTVIEGAKVYSVVMPVTWYGALHPVIEGINKLHPQIVLGIGTYTGLPGLQWEVVGCNYMTSYPDSAYPVPLSVEAYRPIDRNGPELSYLTFPAEIAAEADLYAGIPAKVGGYIIKDGRRISTAGTYLCNYFCYSVSRYVEVKKLDILVGFVHIPQRPEYVAMDYLSGRRSDLYANMPINLTIEGVKIGLAAAIDSVFGAPKFKFSNLTITPSEPVLGQPVKISVTVTNLSPGEYSRTVQVHLQLFGKTVQVKEVTLAPNESKNVVFEIVPDSPTTYLINIEGLIKMFTPQVPNQTSLEQYLSS